MIFMMPTNVWQIVIIIYLKNNDKMDSMNLEKAHKPKSSTKQLEFHVAAVYEEISTILQEVQSFLCRRPICKYRCPPMFPPQWNESI